MKKYYAVGRRIYLEGPTVPHYMVAECDCSERAREFVDGVTDTSPHQLAESKRRGTYRRCEIEGCNGPATKIDQRGCNIHHAEFIAWYEAEILGTTVAILEEHEGGFDIKAVLVPPGQSLDFDEGTANRKWLWADLGRDYHLKGFTKVTKLLEPK